MSLRLIFIKMDTINEYNEFLKRKQHLSGEFGFKANFIPDMAFDFQSYIIENAVKKEDSKIK